MIIVVTGMVGLDKKSYLQKVCELAGQKGTEVLLCNVGDMMYAESPDIKPGKILNIPLKRLHSLRRSVFKDVYTKSKTAKNLIVNTHATFRWWHGLFPAVDFDQMRQLAADMYICLIDGVAALHQRLSDEHFTEHTLKDLIVWREEEIICTEMLCRGVGDNIPFYCLSKGEEKETVETFYRLVFEQEYKKAYLSFPMTQVVEMPAVREQINSFRKKMKEHFISFDPGDLEETYLPIYAQRAKQKGKDSIKFRTPAGETELEVEQVRQIERDINNQTYARDFLLIEQADMIISFIPALDDGRPAISSGVERELQHAHESAKEVFIIWKSKQRSSIFVTQTATKVFGDIEEALDFFRTKGYITK
jgi:adenylate kinase